MSSESYSLAEVAELLGVSKRTLQRQIRDGAFPGRFLAPSPHGMEMRIPATDVARAGGNIESIRPRVQTDLEWSERQLATVPDATPAVAARPVETMQLDVLKEGLMTLIREERVAFLAEVKALVERHEEARTGELRAVRTAVQGIAEELVQVREELRAQEERGLRRMGWAETLGGKPSELDVDGLLAELGELEAMLGVVDS